MKLFVFFFFFFFFCVCVGWGREFFHIKFPIVDSGVFDI